MPLTVVLQERGRRCVVLMLSGELDGDSQPDLARAHDQAVAGDPDTLVLDLAAVAHLDGDGVGLLTALMVRARQCGRTVHATGLSQEHRRMFALAPLEAPEPLDSLAFEDKAAPPDSAGPPGRVVS